jgi:hypothetical protein
VYIQQIMDLVIGTVSLRPIDSKDLHSNKAVLVKPSEYGTIVFIRNGTTNE